MLSSLEMRPTRDDDAPRWSVMIPTFNCARFLRQTLESVLAQDPGADRMQIEVVDDCSTKDDPEAVVRELGAGRVTFYRKPQNAGAIANFNTCIERAHGDWVHILHGDDWVLPGFYDAVGRAFETHRDAGIALVRAFFCDEDGAYQQLTNRLHTTAFLRNVVDEQLYANAIPTPGVVVRRTCYEAAGGFLPSLVHVADWEMWDRIWTLGGAVVINEPLACYRMFEGNDTSRLARSGGHLRDWLNLVPIFRERHASFDASRFRNRVAGMAWAEARRFRSLGDTEAAAANHELWKELATRRDRVKALVRAGANLVRRVGKM